MREKTEAAMDSLRKSMALVPGWIKPLALALLAVLECFNEELKGVNRGDCK